MILDQLAFDEHFCVRQNVAKNSNTASRTLDYLSKDCTDIAACIVHNPNTTFSTLLHLSKRGESLIKREANRRIANGEYKR